MQTTSDRMQPDRKELESMGKVVVEVELTNQEDEILLRKNYIKADAVRRIKIQALVDTGCTMLSIPEEVIEGLGLPFVRELPTQYANGQVEMRKIHGPVKFTVMGRFDYMTILSGHKGRPALIGQIPLEALDLHVDSRNQRLIPNPESPDVQMVYV